MVDDRISKALRIALLGLGIVAVASVDLVVTRPSPEPTVTEVSEPELALAAIPIGPDVFGLGEDLTRVEAELERGETLSGLLDRLEVAPQDGGLALLSLTEPGLLDARRVRPGLKTAVYFNGGALSALEVESEPGQRLMTKRDQTGRFHAAQLNARLTPMPQVISGSISTSIYDQALALGARDQQVVDFAQVFAYDVDFQREIYPGDKFEIVFDVMRDERGQVIKRGEVIYAALHGKAVDKSFYRFTAPDDKVADYFQANGQSATKFLMKTPINGARLSSSFGTRRHPISGYTRLHKGTDFAAPTGTPIFAAGHGTVQRASRYGGYGNYIRVKHANGYETAYAHLSRYGAGIKAGRKVRQGEVIGYVGSTGASTGPHLHFEVYVKGQPVNAMKLKLPTGRKLAETPELMDEFAARRDEIDAMRVAGGQQPEMFFASSVPPAP